MTSVTVVGSVNLDLVATVDRLPRPGETVTDASFEQHPGGKGANQALAASRMGASVSLVACVGGDPEAGLALALLERQGVDRSRVRVRDAPTGVAFVIVDATGENQIVVAPGANRLLTPTDVDVAGADVVVAQLEVPVPVVDAAVGAAAFSVLNAAPARDLPDSVWDAIDVLVVNETEADFYTRRIARLPLAVVTLGAAGAVAYAEGAEVARVPAPAVETVDTVGAGDAFVGALAVEMGAGSTLHRALTVAVTAGALATTVRGAQTSIPERAAVLAAMEAR